MRAAFLALTCALAASAPVRSEEARGDMAARGSLAALAGDRAELLGLFDTKGGFGIIQVAGAAPAVAAKAELPVFPLYAGLEASLAFAQPGPMDTLDSVGPAADRVGGIERPSDLRDALAAAPAAPPGAAQNPPLSLIMPAPPKAPSGPAGWLIITRKTGREVRPLKTGEDVAHWKAAAQLQLSAYEAIVLERFQKNLKALGGGVTPGKASKIPAKPGPKTPAQAVPAK